MKLTFALSPLTGILACAFAASFAIAAPQSYEIGTSSSVSAHTSGDGLLIKTSLLGSLSDVAFSLNNNESYSFDFFRIWTEEGSVEFGEDTTPLPITATLDFDVPSFGAPVSGLTFGGNIIIAQWGSVVWGSPFQVVQGDHILEVSLSDATFNGGLFGVAKGERNGATVRATVTQRAANVPDSGSSVALLSLALACVGFVARRRRA